jgi:nucleoside-diphosphate-sugar epimerase
MNILITGATGFIGGFIVDQALADGLNVIVALRKSSNRQYLTDERIHFTDINLSSASDILDTINEVVTLHGIIDYVIHNAGIVKTTNNDDYHRVNYKYSVNFIQALIKSEQPIKKLTLTSSMAASAPGSEVTNSPIKINDKDEPVSAYGESKKKIELYIEEHCSIPYIILRPPPVFGPRDQDMFTVFDLINKNMEMYVGGKLQLLSFIYVKDLARGIVKSTVSTIENKKYFISDNKEYDIVQFNHLIKKYLNKKTLKVKLPLFLVYIVAFFSEIYTKITGNLSQLNLEKIKEIKCANWMCDSKDFYEDLKIEPQYSLEQGIQETIDWYKKENWLK